MKFKNARLLGLFSGLFLFSIAAFGQAPSPAASPVTHSKTLWAQIVQGGWVMFPIAGCSILTFYFIVDGVMRTSRKRVAPLEHEEAVKNFFRQGDYVSAYNYCKANPTPLTNVLRVGVSLLGDGKHVVEEGMMGELGKENANMQSYISYLSVIGVTTPMLGLLGTVTGMIKAFGKLGTEGIGNPAGLSEAIGEVLVATASGLFIAIPAFAAFYFLRNRAIVVLHHIQDVVNGLFRKMPYDMLAGVHIGDEELYAAVPNWINEEGMTELVGDTTAANQAGAPTGTTSARLSSSTSQQISSAPPQ